MDFKQIVISEKYRNTILNNMKFKNVNFLNNEENEKINLCNVFNIKEEDRQHKTINNSFLFMKNESNYFFLYRHNNNTFDGTIFTVNIDAEIKFIGNNPFDFIK